MKKILCLTLIVLATLFVFTGCSGTASTANGVRNGADGNYMASGKNDQGNVSTSRDGTVNGRNRMGGLMDENGTMNGDMFTYKNNPGAR